MLKFKKLIFFYSLIHIVAILSYLFNYKPVLTFHSFDENKREMLRRSKSEREFELKRENQRSLDIISFCTKESLGYYVEITRKTPDETLEKMIDYFQKKIEKNPLKTQVDSVIKSIAQMRMMSIVVFKAEKNSFPSPIVFSVDGQKNLIDNISQYYLFSNSDFTQKANFWPYTKFSDETILVGEYYKYTFLGIFSGYDWTEFSFYFILPLTIILLVHLYKKYIK